MQDKIFESFLERQHQEGMALAAESDLLELNPMFAFDGGPPQCYLARFSCKGLVRTSDGEVKEADYFEVMISFPSDYLRRANPFEVLSWLGPAQVFHPNISARAPVICIGRLAPGTPLVDILYQCFEIITYNKVTMREDDALNREACLWARANQQRFPLDGRPLKRRALDIQMEAMEQVK
ncbi:MAG: hypothetical protein M3R69_12195 [Acidobacteriota bacterium]|nr:hypothetical protein [Acidobacteriota bacterium]